MIQYTPYICIVQSVGHQLIGLGVDVLAALTVPPLLVFGRLRNLPLVALVLPKMLGQAAAIFFEQFVIVSDS